MPVRVVAIAVLLTGTLVAQGPRVDDRFYQATRSDDLTALRALVRELGVDRPDAQGQTPLMLAAAFGSPAAVRLLLDSGADSRATSSAGTALHWAITDTTKTRMLLDAGACRCCVSRADAC
jgi:ankyrin repeat protein